MTPIWMLIIGALGGICLSELGWVRWVTRLVRKDCGKCPHKGEKEG
jgi:hypothetical protein